MAGVSKKKTEAMQAYAMARVEIRPLSDEVEAMINSAMEDVEFRDRNAAYLHMLKTGQLFGMDVGGEAVNSEEVVVAMVKKFSTTRETARRHVAKSARRKRAPDYQWRDKQGGRRQGAGRPRRYIIEVSDKRAIVNRNVGGSEYKPAANWEEIERYAVMSVELQGGSLEKEKLYNCPLLLAGTAVWDEEEADAQD